MQENTFATSNRAVFPLPVADILSGGPRRERRFELLGRTHETNSSADEG
jgi:hypothetical protein